MTTSTATHDTPTFTAPPSWSARAVDIMQSMYAKKRVPLVTVAIEEPGIPPQLRRRIPAPATAYGPETSASQIAMRVVGGVMYQAAADGIIDAKRAVAIYEHLVVELLRQRWAPNSPQFFNGGLWWAYGMEGSSAQLYRVDPKTGDMTISTNLYRHPQLHACFLLDVLDNLVDQDGICDLLRTETAIFRSGSGAGVNVSKLRAASEPLTGGGTSSGCTSFIKLFDTNGGIIKSGGTTRRAAKMIMLDSDHPDLLAYIGLKIREEQKVAAIALGSHVLATDHDVAIDSDLRTRMRELRAALPERLHLDKLATTFTGEAYRTVDGQNANFSVRWLGDLRAMADDTIKLTRRTDGAVIARHSFADVWHTAAAAAWGCGDPGYHFARTVAAWHTTPSAGDILTSNPCVTGDTLIATTNGPKRISSLVGTHAEILGADGVAHFVDAIFPTGIKPVYALRTKSGYELKVTADHKITTANRGDVPASELTRDDKVQLLPPSFGSETLPQDIAFALGAMLGDGMIHHGKAQEFALLTMADTEADILANVADAINERKKIDGYLDRIGQRAVSSVVTHGPGCKRVNLSYPPVRETLAEYAILDKGSQNKALRDIAFGLDRESTAAILRGLFTTDGTVANYGGKSQYISFDSSSLTLVQQVQQLLLQFGIKSKLYRNRRGGTASTLMPDGKGGLREYPVTETHALRISRTGRRTFEQEIGFHPASHKARQLKAVNDTVACYQEHLKDAFAELVPLGSAPVYDLTEPVTHHFVANGMLVHNCSEFLASPWSGCNLASINYSSFLPEGQTIAQYDLDAFSKICRDVETFLYCTALAAGYPHPKIAQNEYHFRHTGIGPANLGALLMRLCVPYDSHEGRTIAATLASIMTGNALATTAQFAPHPVYSADASNRAATERVMRMHAAAAGVDDELRAYVHDDLGSPIIDHATLPQRFSDALYATWLPVLAGPMPAAAQVSVCAPTGTISLLMDCDFTGIEPGYAMATSKQCVSGATLHQILAAAETALVDLGYDEATRQRIQHDLTSPQLPADTPLLPEHRPIFATATGAIALSPEGHLKMVAALQPHISGGVSKTFNLPNSATVADVERMASQAYLQGIKCVAFYRDGSKLSQPLTAKQSKQCDKCGTKQQIVQTGTCQLCTGCGQSLGGCA